MTTPDAHDDEDIGCLEAIEALFAYLDGEIGDPRERQAIEHHMSHCRSCFSRLELEKRLMARARQATHSEAPQALKDRLRDLLDDL